MVSTAAVVAVEVDMATEMVYQGSVVEVEIGRGEGGVEERVGRKGLVSVVVGMREGEVERAEVVVPIGAREEG